ncbi:prepilin peptidase [Verrucomicrobium spinosum]|uniref:prepilin peptidase n=1 Tax=Verrucomicrobium spinosum TaxID=2736 RepID=UPI0001744E2C|nr:prepilin peptidase [Verrucomicrobium spinosum]
MTEILAHSLIFLLGLIAGVGVLRTVERFPFPFYRLGQSATRSGTGRRTLVVLVTAGLYLAAFAAVRGPWESWPSWGPLLALHWIFITLLIAGTFIDLDHFLLPHEITFGGLAVGLAGTALVPGLLHESTTWRGFLASVAGACVGALLIWLIIQLGKLAFGRLSRQFKEPLSWSVTQPTEEQPPQFNLGDETLSWEDIFFRPTDQLLLSCSELTINDQQCGPCELKVWRDRLETRARNNQVIVQQSMESVTILKGQCTKVVIPREAMGYGDLFLLAMIGSFLGWQGALFTLVGASFLGSAIPLLGAAVLRSKEWSSKIPFGPYLAAAAVIWLFFRVRLLEFLSPFFVV